MKIKVIITVIILCIILPNCVLAESNTLEENEILLSDLIRYFNEDDLTIYNGKLNIEKKVFDADRITEFAKLLKSIVLIKHTSDEMLDMSDVYLIYNIFINKQGDVFEADPFGANGYYFEENFFNDDTLPIEYKFKYPEQMKLLDEFILTLDCSSLNLAKSTEYRSTMQKIENTENEFITRTEFVELVSTMIESRPPANYKNYNDNITPFTDCDDTAIVSIYYNGIINGKGNGIFDPDEHITKQEASVIIHRIMRLYGIEADGIHNDTGDGKTRHLIINSAEWASDAVRVVIGSGIIDYDVDLIDMTEKLTLRESVSSSLRLYDYLISKTTLLSKYNVAGSVDKTNSGFDKSSRSEWLMHSNNIKKTMTELIVSKIIIKDDTNEFESNNSTNSDLQYLNNNTVKFLISGSGRENVYFVITIREVSTGIEEEYIFYYAKRFSIIKSLNDYNQ